MVVGCIVILLLGFGIHLSSFGFSNLSEAISWFKIEEKQALIASEIPEYTLTFREKEGKTQFLSYLDKYNFWEDYGFFDTTSKDWSVPRRILLHLTSETQPYLRTIKDDEKMEPDQSVGSFFDSKTRTVHLYIHISKDTLKSGDFALLGRLASATVLQAVYQSVQPYVLDKSIRVQNFATADYQAFAKDNKEGFLEIEKASALKRFLRIIKKKIVREARAYWVCRGQSRCCDNGNCWNEGCWEDCDAFGCHCINYAAQCGHPGSNCHYDWVAPTPTPTPPPGNCWCGNCATGTCALRSIDTCNASYGGCGCSNCNGNGNGNGGTCDDPDQPTPLTFSNITGDSARVSWPGVGWGDESGSTSSCSPNNGIGCGGSRGYVGRICTGNYCHEGGTEIDILSCTSNTYWDISGLTSGTRYYVYIWSINSCTCDKRKRDNFATGCPPVSRVLSGSCTAEGTANLSWDEAPGATSYSLRVDNLADVNDWDGSCSSPAGDFCANVPSSNCRRGFCSYSFAGNPGDTYNWWIHSRGANGCWSPLVSGPNFTCPIPSCTSATLSPPSPVSIVEGEPQVFVVSSIDFTGGADWSNVDHVEFISSNPGAVTVSPAVDSDGSNGYSTTATAVTTGTATITADVYFTP